jgi:hypothetical protein
MHEQEKFYSLLALVCRKWPRYAVEATLNADYGKQYGEAAARRLYNVKQGKVVNLADLVALIRHSLPKFEIPAHLLPEPAEQEAPVTA